MDDEPALRDEQFAHIQREAERGVPAHTQRLSGLLSELDPPRKLTLLEMAMPALKALSRPQYDRFIANVVALIKMDIQGAEYVALRGMEQTIRKNPRLALCAEFWPYGLKKSGTSADTFLEHLDRLGLTVEQLARFVELHAASGLEGRTLAIVECNREQIGLIAQEVAASLGVSVRPVSLTSLRSRGDAAST